jgi:hypothetical protein
MVQAEGVYLAVGVGKDRALEIIPFHVMKGRLEVGLIRHGMK